MSQSQKRASLKSRVLGMLIDYQIIGLYIGLLLLSAFTFGLIANPPRLTSPWMGELIGFSVLTLPVSLYFIVTESSSKQASLGKQFVDITIADRNGNRPTYRQIIIRNGTKFLPWEIAHMSIWHIFVPNGLGGAFINSGLVVSNVLLLAYLLTITFRHDHGGPYDVAAGTELYTR